MTMHFTHKKQRSAPEPLGDLFQQQLADFPSYFLFFLLVNLDAGQPEVVQRGSPW